MSDPINEAKLLGDVRMTDPRWPHEEGWVKMAKKIENNKEKIEIHYVFNEKTNQFDDFKFKK